MLDRVIVAIKIVPGRDAVAYTVVSEGDRVWHKKYASMADATCEAVELQIMTSCDRQRGDMTQPTNLRSGFY